ncbi:MAG: hypothetical protein KBT39_06220 [Bacteroidales bacterium]|nr:hypothetical protein [Bacteroidales bacterium]
MKKLFYVAATAAMLASCTSEIAPEEGTVEAVKYPVEFSGARCVTTRATGSAAATLLSNEFTVYGVKLINSTSETVFNGTPVKFASNAWNYSSATEETRYWDPNATAYQFLTFSDANNPDVVVAPGIANIADGITIGTTSQNVSLDALQKVYVAPGITVQKENFTSPVTFSFRNAAAKVRVAFFNAIPGYDVIIDNFYPSDANDAVATKAATLFNTNGFFTGAAYSVDTETATTTVIGTPTTASTFALGTKCADVKLGRNIVDATFDQAEKAWTWAMPVNGASKDINLKIDYRLVSKHETINRTSFVTVPANYAQWKANHAYTYYFRITDNDLHPITFTAQVIDFETNEQETITTIDGEQEVNITTWAEGSTVQITPVYKVGDVIYVSVTNCTNPGVEVAHTSNTDVDGSNAGTLIDDNDYETLIPATDGRYSFTANKGAGKYVIRVSYKDSTNASKVAFKVVTVNEPSNN